MSQQVLNVAEDYLKNREDILNGLLVIWKNIIERVFAYYRQAAAAYFTYLKLSGTEVLLKFLSKLMSIQNIPLKNKGHHAFILLDITFVIAGY